MTNLYARTVFFVTDADRSLRYYTEQLGFSLDWDSNDGVFQVSLFGFELILNQVGDRTQTRPGHGRVFIGLDDDQGEPLRKHIADKAIQTLRVEWGRPTLVIRDVDANELFFWMPHDLGVVATVTTDVSGKFQYVLSEPIVVKSGQPSPMTTYRLTVTPPRGSPFAAQSGIQVFFMEQFPAGTADFSYYLFPPKR